MADISALVENGYLNRAGNRIFDSLVYLINTRYPGAEISKEDFELLMPLVVEKIKKQGAISDKTPLPGDDIITNPSRGFLLVCFQGPEGLKVPNRYIKTYAVGADFEFEVPQIEGYVTDFTVIKGKMSTTNVHIVVEYKKAPLEPVAPLYGKMTGKKDNKKKSSYYTDSRDMANFQIVEGGTYYKDTFLNDSDDPEMGVPHKPGLGYWWPAVVLHAPETMTDDEPYNSVQARYYNLKKSQWVQFSLDTVAKAANSETSAYPEDVGERKSYLWLPVTVNDLKYPNGSDGFYHQLIQVDWNQDGIYEQNFDIAIKPDSIKLYDDKENENMIWPEEY